MGYYRITIDVDWNDVKSIRLAENKKTKLKNSGYTLIATYGGITTSTLVFRKED